MVVRQKIIKNDSNKNQKSEKTLRELILPTRLESAEFLHWEICYICRASNLRFNYVKIPKTSGK